ncbi:hypothetical protein [Aquicella lusitana]|uniref:Uncharacterized protein n=1 Tax=Aquicella lusitana TaxID=254246 RepID=A0A370GG50_9COXI|nr:hypothetical protein [Aquicella lusitana]RDI42089.1 hypothetical protein C8D86_11643 [Aquicella lusitana]VVC74404.1 hypothetical protein AQULUS_21700 [Aquicella lusitana]
MLLALSSDDPVSMNVCDGLAVYYKEKDYRRFTDDCFQNLSDPTPERITCVGHAGTNSYGDRLLSPDEFVQELIKKGLPASVKTIDLIGCEIGFITGGTSYARETAILLAQNGYDIQVNAFTKTGPETLNISHMYVCIFGDTGKIWVTGYKDTEENQIKDQLLNSEIQKIKEQINAKKFELEMYFISSTEVAGAGPDVVDQLKKNIAELNNQLDKYQQELYQLQTETMIYESLCDLRLELDHYTGYQFNGHQILLEEQSEMAGISPEDKSEQLKIQAEAILNKTPLDQAKDMALEVLADTIKKLGDEKPPKSSSFLQYLPVRIKNPADILEYKINELAKLKLLIENDHSDQWIAHIDRARENKKLTHGLSSIKINDTLEIMREQFNIGINLLSLHKP